MKKDKDKSAQAAELRRQAEQCLRDRTTQAARPGREQDSLRLLHELQVHQVELEMQNEELLATRSEVEAGLERYADLYNFAPMGYFTLDRNGAIQQANLTGSCMLGVGRADLVNRRFGPFVRDADRQAFNAFLAKVFADRTPEACEVALRSQEASPVSPKGPGEASLPRHVRIEASATGDGQACRAVVTDITARRRANEHIESLARFPDENPNPVLRVDASGVILYANAAAEEKLLMPWGSRPAGVLPKSVGAPVAAALKKNTPTEMEISTANRTYLLMLAPIAKAGYVNLYASDITERKQIEDTQLFLLECGSRPTGEDFFQSLARHLAESLAMDFVCIDQLVGDGLAAQTVAMYEDGKFLDNVEYALKDTPCGEVVGKAVCCFPKGVRQLFPKDEVLQKMMSESYVGITLWSFDGKPIGLIAVIGKKPLTNPRLAEVVLKLVAVRAAGELERRQVEQALRDAHDELEVRVKERTADLGRTVEILMQEVRDRLAAEKMLKTSEERFRLIAETVQDVFWISTPGMEKMLYISPAYEEIWGRSRESLYEHPESFMEAIHPEDRARMIAGQAHNADGQWDFEYRIVRPDGTILWVRDRGYPICDEQGKLTGMAGTATDITARKLREQDLAESQARLAKAQEIAQLGNWEWDIASNELWWSDQICHVFGTTPDEFEATYDAFLSFVHPDDRAEVESAVKESLDSAAPYSIDHRIIRRDGAERVVHESGQLIRDSGGRPIRMSGTVQDITQRKQIEDELHESEQRYRELVELSPIGIMVSVKGEIVFVNSAAAAILGVSQPGELVGRKIEDLVHSDYSREVRDRLRRVREMRVELPLTEMRMSKADGTMVVVESASAFVMYQQEPAVQTVFRDVTERNRQKAIIERERQRLFAVLNMLPGYVALIGPDFSVRFANHRYLEAFGELGDRPCHMIQHGRDKPCEDCPLPRVFGENRAMEYEWTSPQGQTYRTWAYPFSDMDGSTVALTIGLDVTERKALEKQVIDASEIERRSIGRDLHDSLGQELTGLGLLVESLVKDVAELAPEKTTLGEQIIKLIRYAVSQVRSLSKGLDPVSFRGGGLAAGLRDLAEDVRKQSGVECEFHCNDGVSVEDEAAATHLYRIAQEAVNNAIKHADACLITICLTNDGSGIHLIVTDDGRGLPDGVEDGNAGMGMRTMRYRASVLGGTLNVAADAGGTKVTCFIPASRVSQLEDIGPWAPKKQ